MTLFQKIGILLLSLVVGSNISAQEKDENLRSLHQEIEEFQVANNIDNESPRTMEVDSRIESAASDIQLLQLLDAISRNEDLFAKLELAEEQQEKVYKILAQYQSLKQALDDKSVNANDVVKNHHESVFRNECRNLTKQLSETFVGFQTLELLNAKLGRGGLLELLTTPTLIAEHVDLSDAQKKRIQEKHAELGKEVLAFIEQKRNEASLIFADEMSDEQKEKLVQLLGGDQISQFFENASPESLIIRSRIDANAIFDTTIDEWREIEKRSTDKR